MYFLQFVYFFDCTSLRNIPFANSFLYGLSMKITQRSPAQCPTCKKHSRYFIPYMIEFPSTLPQSLPSNISRLDFLRSNPLWESSQLTKRLRDFPGITRNWARSLSATSGLSYGLAGAWQIFPVKLAIRLFRPIAGRRQERFHTRWRIHFRREGKRPIQSDSIFRLLE